jgi:putative ABC transport system permease protein
MDLFATRTDRELPAAKGWFHSRVIPLQKQVAGDSRKPLLLILSAVALALLIVCFNVAGLLLTRSLTRQREFSVRVALGAGPARVVRQLLTESLLRAFAGGIAGMGVTTVAIRLVKIIGPPTLPRLPEAQADFRVFGFTFALTVATAILFGPAPTLGIGGSNLAESLKECGQKSQAGTICPHIEPPSRARTSGRRGSHSIASGNCRAVPRSLDHNDPELPKI